MDYQQVRRMSLLRGSGVQDIVSTLVCLSAVNYLEGSFMAQQLVLSMYDTNPVADHYAESTSGDRGAVFTKREVVDFILDLSGYTQDQSLENFRLLEPSFGQGDFLIAAVERLLSRHLRHGIPRDNGILTRCIHGVEVHDESIRITHEKLRALFTRFGLPDAIHASLLESWLHRADFLLTDLPGSFTHVIGNPPYVRQESIPDPLLREYRFRYRSIYDRADLYVPFIERGLQILSERGTLAYICSDRWMKNRYGQVLRGMVAGGYHLDYYVDMVDTPAFHSRVSAYPAITVISRGKKRTPTRIAHQPDLSAGNLSTLAGELRADRAGRSENVFTVSDVVDGSQPWILHSFDQLAIVRRLERTLPTMEQAGCKIGIGVATGSDRVFIGRKEELDVEPDRLLPLVTTRDIVSGAIKWRGEYVLNPFDDAKGLVSLHDYPRLRRYFEMHEEALKARNCAKRNERSWYRTIDRIHPSLRNTPKLLIPDIKGKATVVYDAGEFYPHHNLYYITSGEWDLRALQLLLQSGIARLFVATYSTKMRGGYLRYQAQYLRRIRLPLWKDIPLRLRNALLEAGRDGDMKDTEAVVFDIYGFSRDERHALGGNGSGKTQ